MATGGPDYSRLYLDGRIQKGHPMFEELHRMYGPTPEGKRLAKFEDDNVTYLDGLQRLNPAQIDMILNSEGIQYNGQPDDRIMKINIIRLARDKSEEATLSTMTEEEQDAYFDEKEKKQNMELASLQKVMELQGHADQGVIAQKIDRAAQIRQRREDYLKKRAAQKDAHRSNQKAQGDASLARAGEFQHPLDKRAQDPASEIAKVDQQAVGPVHVDVEAENGTDKESSNGEGTDTASSGADAPTGKAKAPKAKATAPKNAKKIK